MLIFGGDENFNKKSEERSKGKFLRMIISKNTNMCSSQMATEEYQYVFIADGYRRVSACVHRRRSIRMCSSQMATEEYQDVFIADGYRGKMTSVIQHH